jgi:hypothetical protein
MNSRGIARFVICISYPLMVKWIRTMVQAINRRNRVAMRNISILIPVNPIHTEAVNITVLCGVRAIRYTMNPGIVPYAVCI